MKRLKLVLLLGAIVAIAATIGVFATRSAGAEDGGTALRSYNEVPSISVPSAFGEVRLRIDDSSQTILFLVNWSGLTGPPSAAHIHLGQPGVNGGVSAFFCGGSTKPTCPQSTSAQITGTIVPADVIGPTGQGIGPGEWGELVTAIRAGFTYANAHTALYPGGEIRGQLQTSR